jgi:endoribonuclease Dicer
VSVTKEDIKSALENAHQPQGSTSRILAEQDFTAAIADPREYQIELFEKAKERNTIAVLDTGITTTT